MASTGTVVVLVCLLVCFVWGALEDPQAEGTSGGTPSVSCGLHGMNVTFPLGSFSPPFSAFMEDKNGLYRPLMNDPACRTWVSQQPDGSVVIGADYAGCAMAEEDGEYTMSVDVEYLPGKRTFKHLKCPLFSAMDAPGSDVCAAVIPRDRIPCGPVTQAACIGSGCCYNAIDPAVPCYFASPVTAQCSPDGKATIAISAAATVPPLNLGTVRLVTVSSSCQGLSVNTNGAFLVYSFPLSCGSSYQVAGRTVNENRLESTQEILSWSGSSITRDSTFGLTVRCTFSSSSSFIPLQVEVLTLPPPLPVSSPGPLVLEMRIAKDQTYNSYYGIWEYPVLKILQEPVFVEVRILQRTDPSLVLVLNECWATQSSNPMQQPQWPILIGGCPFQGDNYKTQLIPITAAGLQFPLQYNRFAVSTFTFVDNAQRNIHGQVYFHCSASVCVPSVLGSCSTVCPSRKRRDVSLSDSRPLNLVTAAGPIYFATEEEDGLLILEGSRSSRPSSALMPSWTIGAFVAVGLLTVVMFAFGLWNYHRVRESKMVAVNT
ncbi:hypothetical protein NDU88_006715 [Pleurodeles waltl]|uniref:Zona pellucida sperm-binding protein 4 n=1 Tax=Pleurodeles waltl TaxID=8319 RepID=A0AAV7PLU6_PLEWA|nr:hypothetical protein NDU88_006715 [Pleurodeles waltl]